MEKTSVSGGACTCARTPPHASFPTQKQVAESAGEDMTGVDPLRMAEVRRRVAAIKSYIALPAPDDRARRRHAKSLGLSVNQFLALVRVWRETGRANAVSGSGASRGTLRPKGPRNLPTESKEAARAVVRSLGADVSHVDAVAAVEARCKTLGVRAPSRSTVWNMVMAARRDAGARDGADGLVLSRCHAKLPVEHPGGVAYPSLLLLVDAAKGTVLVAAMDEDETALDTLADALPEHAAAREIVIDADLATTLGAVDSDMVRVVKPSAARTATARALGRGFGSIELIYQLSRAVRPERTLRSRKDRPLSLADARGVVLEQLSVHNRARGAGPPMVSWGP